MIGDGVCDEATNTKRCLFDGGDCCLPKKSTPLCKICTCKMDIDQESLQTDIDQLDVRVLDAVTDFANQMDFDRILDVEDVASVKVCAKICIDATLTKSHPKVNGWIFDFESGLCSCSFWDSTLCLTRNEKDLERWTIANEDAVSIVFAFVMWSRMLKCGDHAEPNH